jgi:hypothetical protein
MHETQPVAFSSLDATVANAHALGGTHNYQSYKQQKTTLNGQHKRGKLLLQIRKINNNQIKLCCMQRMWCGSSA